MSKYLLCKMITAITLMILSGCVSNSKIHEAEVACKFDGGFGSYSEWGSVPSGTFITCQNGTIVKISS